MAKHAKQNMKESHVGAHQQPAPTLSYSAGMPLAAKLSLAVVAVVILFLAGYFGVTFILGMGSSTSSGSSGESSTLFGVSDTAVPAYESPYNWENLTWENDVPSYSIDGQCVSKLGVDVSEHDGSFDWETAVNDGIEFAFLRVGYRGYTEGGLYVDEQFESNYRNASAQGIDLGVYFYSSAISADEAVEEADFVIQELESVGASLQLPVAFDFERVSSADARTNKLTRSELTDIANAFCQRLEDAGYTTIVYGNQQDLAVYDSSVTANRSVWLAEYDTSTPTAQFDFCIWQFTNNGSLSGISRNVDLDLWFTQPLSL